MNNQLLADLTIILNANQDIQDALEESPVNIEKIIEANNRIGSAVTRLLPG